MNCPICSKGTLEETQIEKWMKRGERWLLFRNVPALVCDLCGEATFTRDTTDRLLAITNPDGSYTATGSRWVLEFDLKRMNERPVRSVRGTTAPIVGTVSVPFHEVMPPISIGSGAVPFVSTP